MLNHMLWLVYGSWNPFSKLYKLAHEVGISRESVIPDAISPSVLSSDLLWSVDMQLK